MRALDFYERQILAKALGIKGDCLPSGIEPIGVERVGEEDLDFYHLKLHYAEDQWRGGGYSIIADWLGDDTDGGVISLLALGDTHRRVHEIEIRRLDTQPIQKLPSIDAWRPA